MSIILRFNCILQLIELILVGPDNWGYINDAENGEGMIFSPLSRMTEIVISSVYYQWYVTCLNFNSMILANQF